MALAKGKDRIKKERRQIYMDIILGIISALIALVSIIFAAILNLLKNKIMFITGLSFWICWLAYSFFLLGLGIYAWYSDKHFDERPPRKDLKPPII